MPDRYNKYNLEFLNKIRKTYCASCCGNHTYMNPILKTKEGEKELFYFCSEPCMEYYIGEFDDLFEHSNGAILRENKKHFWN